MRADDREFTACGDVDDLDGIRSSPWPTCATSRTSTCAPSACASTHYFLESSLYTDGRVERTVAQLVAAGKTYEHDGALWLRTTDYGDDKDRVMRKSDGTLHLLRAGRRLPRRASGSAASPR